jgi:hypothetical protein
MSCFGEELQQRLHGVHGQDSVGMHMQHSSHTVYLFNLFPIFRCSHQSGLYRWGCRATWSHHRVKQVLAHGGWVLATAGVHRRCLDWCCEVQRASGSASVRAGQSALPVLRQHTWWEWPPDVPHCGDIQCRIKRQQPLLIQLNAASRSLWPSTRRSHRR